VQLGVGLGVRVLRRDAGAELNVLANGGAERLVVGHPRGVERRYVQLDEALALLLGDLEPAMHVDQVLKAELAREPVGTAERLGSEHRQVIDMLGLAVAEQWLQQRVSQDAVVEELLEAMESLLAASVLE
jgi:hypothetical protein